MAKLRRRITVIFPILLLLFIVALFPAQKTTRPPICLIKSNIPLQSRLDFAYEKLKLADNYWSQLSSSIQEEQMSDYHGGWSKPHKLQIGFKKLEELEQNQPNTDSLTLKIAALWSQAWKACPPQKCAPILTQKPEEDDTLSQNWKNGHDAVATSNWGLPGSGQLPDRRWLDQVLFPRIRSLALDVLKYRSHSPNFSPTSPRYLIGDSYWQNLKFGKPSDLSTLLSKSYCLEDPINVLFVGNRYYSHHYEASLTQQVLNGTFDVIPLPVRYLSADIDPMLEPWGSSQPFSHATYPLEQWARLLKTFRLPQNSLDIVILNGIWGENSDYGTYQESCNAVFRGLHRLVKHGGVVVIGWNKSMKVFNACMIDQSQKWTGKGENFWNWFEPLNGWMGLPFEVESEESDHTFHLFRHL